MIDISNGQIVEKSLRILERINRMVGSSSADGGYLLIMGGQSDYIFTVIGQTKESPRLLSGKIFSKAKWIMADPDKVSSAESGIGAGAIRAGDVIIAFAGYDGDDANEYFALRLGVALGLINHHSAHEIARISENRFYFIDLVGARNPLELPPLCT